MIAGLDELHTRALFVAVKGSTEATSEYVCPTWNVALTTFNDTDATDMALGAVAVIVIFTVTDIFEPSFV